MCNMLILATIIHWKAAHLTGSVFCTIPVLHIVNKVCDLMIPLQKSEVTKFVSATLPSHPRCIATVNTNFLWFSVPGALVLRHILLHGNENGSVVGNEEEVSVEFGQLF